MRFNFRVVQNLEVPVTLRITFIDRFVNDIFPAGRKVVPYSYKSVPLFMLTVQTYKNGQEDNKHEGSILFVESKEVSSQEIQVVRQKICQQCLSMQYQ